MNKIINKKSLVTAIIMLAVMVSVWPGIGQEAAAASNAPKKIKMKISSKVVDIKGKSQAYISSVTPKKAYREVTFRSGNTKNCKGK